MSIYLQFRSFSKYPPSLSSLTPIHCSTPFCLALRADGVYTVKDLIKVNVGDYGLPHVLREQVTFIQCFPLLLFCCSFSPPPYCMNFILVI